MPPPGDSFVIVVAILELMLSTQMKQCERFSVSLERVDGHPINAKLNYAYAALLTKMKIQAICDGCDPMIGILHDQRHKEKEITASFALDLMEPHRPVVDRGILKLIAEETFSGADFDLQSDGVVRVGPGLVRKCIATSDVQSQPDSG